MKLVVANELGNRVLRILCVASIPLACKPIPLRESNSLALALGNCRRFLLRCFAARCVPVGFASRSRAIQTRPKRRWFFQRCREHARDAKSGGQTHQRYRASACSYYRYPIFLVLGRAKLHSTWTCFTCDLAIPSAPRRLRLRQRTKRRYC